MEFFKSDNNNTDPAQQNASGDKRGALGGLISSKQGPVGINPAEITREINTQSRKIRINEERAAALRKKIQVIEHNMLSSQKKFLGEIKFINEELSDLRRSIDDIKSKLIEFSRELQDCAKKEEMMVLQKYINMWEPVNFVTRREVEKIINEKLGK